MTRIEARKYYEWAMWAILCALITFGLAAAVGCAGADDDQEYDSTDQDLSFAYRTSLVIGTQDEAHGNVACNINQSASTKCYLVKPIGEEGIRTYNVFVDDATFAATGVPWHTAVADAAANLTAGFSTGPQTHGASFVMTSDRNAAQCLIRWGQIAAPSPPTTATSAYMKVHFNGTHLLTQGGDVVGVGSWYTADWADIFIDDTHGSPTGNMANMRKQLSAAALLHCVGMGRQGSVNTAYDFTYMQLSVTNVNDRWGTNNCEHKFVWYYSAPIYSNRNETWLVWTRNQTPACVLP